MARPKHTAFLDLEETLAHRLRNAWSRYWGKVSAEIVTLCSLGQFDAAHRVAESIDLAPLFDRSRTFARTVGMSALLLGASRITAPRKSVVAKQPPKRELDAFLRQTETMLARNASQALRQMAHEWVNQEEATLLKAEWREEDHPRGKTTPESTPGSFAPATKAVDAEGNPLRLFHGTNAEFSTFRTPAMFSVKRDYAAQLGSRVVEVRLNIKNPADLNAMHISPSDPNFPEIAKQLQAQGYDSAQYRGEAWIAFDPAQIEQIAGVSMKFDAEVRGNVTFNHILLGGQKVGHISGFVEQDKFRIYRTEIDKVQRGTGAYRAAVQQVANKYGGAFTYADEASPQLQASLKKMPTYEWADFGGRNALLIHPEIEKAEWKAGVAKLDTGADRNQVKINVAGKNYFGLAASIQVSRMSAFGFLLEAAESGVTNYRVDAVLDERTCEVCRHMDGWVFPVEAGLQLAQQIMDTEDPEALKALAPFYAQNKASLAALGGYGTEDFINEGMSLPPYHPLCRCILTPTDEPADVHPTQIEDRVALASQTLYGEGDGVRLTRDLFGIEQPTPQDRRSIGDVVPDTELEELDVAPWLDRLTTEPTPEKPPVAPEQVHEWMQELLHDWLAQPAAAVPPDALVTPTPFEGTTIPQEYVRQFQPSRLAQLAQARWPWLAGLFGWLALEPDRPLFEDDSALVAEEELADEERDERDELREDRRP